jgi:DNA polymerase-3 subunit delta'
MATTAVSTGWPIVGHDWAVNLLQRTIVAGRLPHALLITGPPNVGKGTLARVWAQTLLCTDEPRPCGLCRACRRVSSGNHPDLRWIEPDNGSLKIAQVRELTRQISLAPVESRWQIAVLDRFELTTAGAANALLKTLEEPPPSALLVLLAQQAEALLPTITSRCQVLALRPIPRATVEQALVERWQIPVPEARLLSHICGGRLGWAVSASSTPALLEQRRQQLDNLTRLLVSSRVERFGYAEILARQTSESVLDHLELWMSWWRDLLLVINANPIPLTNIDRQSEFERWAGRLTNDAVLNVLSALRETMDQLSFNANMRLALEILFLKLPFLAP